MLQYKKKKYLLAHQKNPGCLVIKQYQTQQNTFESVQSRNFDFQSPLLPTFEPFSFK